MNSQTGGRVRSATIVTVTNQGPRPNPVTVSWFKGFSNNTAPVAVTSFVVPPDFTVSIASPALVFDEGPAIVSARLPEIGVSARVYYTARDRDEELLAITDSKVVVFGAGNAGD